MENMILLRSYGEKTEAEAAQGALISQGIAAVVLSNDISNPAEDAFRPPSGDAKLFVAKDDYDRAREILGV